MQHSPSPGRGSSFMLLLNRRAKREVCQKGDRYTGTLFCPLGGDKHFFCKMQYKKHKYECNTYFLPAESHLQSSLRMAGQRERCAVTLQRLTGVLILPARRRQTFFVARRNTETHKYDSNTHFLPAALHLSSSLRTAGRRGRCAVTLKRVTSTQ